MTDEAKEALEDVTRAVADASRVTTPAERLKHLLELVLAEVSVLDEQANPTDAELDVLRETGMFWGGQEVGAGRRCLTWPDPLPHARPAIGANVV